MISWPVDAFDYDAECTHPDYHAVVSIMLVELYDAKFCDSSFTGWEWPKLDDKQDARLRWKLFDHYKYREIALVPPARWKHEFIRKMREIMPKYVLLYKLLEETPELYGGVSEWYKGRVIFSDFPQTQLSGDNGDYASSGNDREFQRIHQADFIETAERVHDFNDVDMMVIDDMSSLFSCLFTVNANAY